MGNTALGDYILETKERDEADTVIRFEYSGDARYITTDASEFNQEEREKAFTHQIVLNRMGNIYVNLMQYDVKHLARPVNLLLKCGWMIQGGMSVIAVTRDNNIIKHYQTMYKEKQK